MESLTYASVPAQRNIFQSNNVVPLIKVKATNFPEGNPPVIAAGHKNLCFTSKKPDEVRVLDRITAQKVDLPVGFKVQQVTCVSADALFAVAGENTVALIAAEAHPDGTITAEVKATAVLEGDGVAVRGIAACGTTSVAAVTSQGQVVVLPVSGPKRTFALPSVTKAPVKSCVMAVHQEAALAIVPGKGTALDIVSLNSEKSVLSKGWIPHGEDTPSSAYFFQVRSFGGGSSNSQQQANKYILTAANDNTELRFWVLGDDKSVSLLQQLTVTVDSDELPAQSADKRLLSVSSNEEYILLSSTTTGSIVVVELDRTQFKLSRATDWNPTGPLIFAAPITRKVQDGKSLSIDFAAVIRTVDTVSIVTFDTARLVGASNLFGGAASTSPVAPLAGGSSGSLAAAAVGGSATAAATASNSKGNANSISKWFGAAAVGGDAAQGGTPSLGTAMSSPLPTSVSSSITGRVSSTADAQYITSQAVSAIKGQSGQFRDALSAIDNQIVVLQKQASVAIKTLQEPKSKDDAQLAGREFALRNKHRLQAAAGAAGTAGATAMGQMTPQQVELMQGLKNFVDTLTPSVREASSDTCRRLLASTLPQAIARAMAAADTVEQDMALPDMTVTKGMQQFGAAVDKVHQSQNNMLKQERNGVESLSQRLMQGGDRIAKTLQASKAFLAALKSEVGLLKKDVFDAKSAVVSKGAAGGFATAAAPTAEEIVEQAKTLAYAGKWAEAVSLVERTGDLSILMHFLSAVQDNTAVLVDPQTLPMTLAVQVCYRLALNLREQLGNVPFRTKWIHDFLVDWDEALSAAKQSDPKLFAIVSEPLEAILSNLEEIDVRKEVDRSTKNQITLCRKLLASLV